MSEIKLTWLDLTCANFKWINSCKVPCTKPGIPKQLIGYSFSYLGTALWNMTLSGVDSILIAFFSLAKPDFKIRY